MVFGQILYPADYCPARNRKNDKLFGDDLDFEDIKFPVKIKDIHKMEKKNSIGISVSGYENKKKHWIYIVKKNVDFLLIGKKERRPCVLTNRGKKHNDEDSGYNFINSMI